MGNWMKEEEHKRYGNLLERAEEAEKQKQKETLKAIDSVIECLEQSEKEKPGYQKKKDFRQEMLNRAKKRLNRDYNL